MGRSRVLLGQKSGRKMSPQWGKNSSTRRHSACRKSRPLPAQSRTKKVFCSITSIEQNSFCCSFLGFPGPRLRAAGPPPSCAGGLLPGAGASAPLWVLSGCSSGRGSRSARRRSGAPAGPRRIRGAPRGASAPAAGRGPSTVRPYGAAGRRFRRALDRRSRAARRRSRS